MPGTTELPLFGPNECPNEVVRPKTRTFDTPLANCSGVMPIPPTSMRKSAQSANLMEWRDSNGVLINHIATAPCSGVLPQPVFVAYPGTQVELHAGGHNYDIGEPYYFGGTAIGTVMSRPDERGQVRLSLSRPFDVTNLKVVSGQFGFSYSREFL